MQVTWKTLVFIQCIASALAAPAEKVSEMSSTLNFPRVKVCEHGNFTGRCEVFNAHAEPEKCSPFPLGWNDVASSVKIWVPLTHEVACTFHTTMDCNSEFADIPPWEMPGHESKSIPAPYHDALNSVSCRVQRRMSG
ncbi:hypothetical protein JX265_000645 [Neoarthrinium moseri]|uniref:Uncharacterized protein n=1 Tax=Neoarthrinium moseri TaxID=1658444 RepID=A0A9P9WZ68_9PEZI|nr:hypothetical protein JX265_000645 [Neoarthrinium moseri]